MTDPNILPPDPINTVDDALVGTATDTATSDPIKRRKTRQKRKPKAANTTAGADLIPDLSKLTKGVVGEYWYWIGALPGCPREHLDIGSTDFPKMVEDVSVHPHISGKTRRVPRIGSVRKLTLDQLERIRADLPQVVIRFTDDTPSPGGAGDGLEALDPARRKGHPIRIPTDEAMEKSIKNGHPMRRYVASAQDEPAAEYVFAELCSNQDRGSREDYYPAPLSETGLEWPVNPKE